MDLHSRAGRNIEDEGEDCKRFLGGLGRFQQAGKKGVGLINLGEEPRSECPSSDSSQLIRDRRLSGGRFPAEMIEAIVRSHGSRPSGQG